ncbi:hypothetical protein ACFFX1_46660 [Dactylosporangium sucinum]|uniref:Uncharacterized protein n=1 Tax=Dactylosporangium sucinum TaxID=1424081 RepID=A0A917U9N5_9ACTN|nr:hypothetical protein [Dactylosporangium sucinum]GGM67934.1 hypothetical protein GCM10007977_082190 [Dactylosporangium sucinum]
MDRQRLLSGVAARLETLGIAAEFGLLVPYQDFYGSSPDGPGRMQVTVVAARRTVPPGEGGLSADGRMWVRDVDLDYELSGDELAALLGGYPIDYRHARYTETWVRTLHEQLRDCAPWRLATAYRVSQPGKPIPLFGLKGMNHQVKPMVALDAPDGVPRLTMHWTGSNARLSRALWEIPADLRAALL